ncbi:MAG: transglutaminase domain-containing protein [Coprobacillaceae bacterium]
MGNDKVFSLGSIFGVIAKNDTGYSRLSYFDTKEYSREELVCQAASFASEEVAQTTQLEGIEQIPNQLPATACSGNTINAEVILDYDNAEIQDDGLHVPYVLNNSTLTGAFIISTYDKSNYEDDIKQKNKDISSSYNKENSHDYRYKDTKVIAFNVKASNTLPDITDTIYTTSELETFVVSNMIDGAAMIDISNFEYSTNDYEYIYDLIEQIRSQNPLVLQILDYYYNSDEQTIYIHYLYDNETRYQNQQTIRDEVARISGEIMNDNMSDVEKVYAINKWICDNTTYNYDAVEAGTVDDGYHLHKDYYHANTAEGVFMQGTAVCEGYAAAFMLLADAVDIDTIMVTGSLLNSLDTRHAWNRVLIDDQWYVVDVTNNDMEETPNSVLLLADTTADQIYVEDEYFVLDEDLDKYRATGDDIYEYYRNQNLTVSTTSEAASLLVSQLQSSSQATVRVPLSMSEGQYDTIADSVVNQINRGITYYWINGVLTIYKS